MINLINRDSTASYLLDLIRFMVAIFVVLFHMGIEIFPGYEAVIVFFVLSGYFISQNILKNMINNTFSWKNYLIERLSRLYVVLIPSLLLSFLLIYIDIQWFDNEDKYADYLSWKLFFKDLLYLQFLDTKMFAYNGPLWSLAYEFWFYLLFPSIMSIFYYKSFFKKIFFVFISLLIFIFTFKLQGYFFIWLLGILPVVVKFDKFSLKQLKFLNILALLLFFVSLNLLYFNFHTNHINNIDMYYRYDLFVAVSTSLLLITIISTYNNIKEKNIILKYARIGSGFTFSLYLLHYPLFHFLADFKSYIEKTIGFHNYIFSVSWYLLILVSILFYSYLISLMTEAKTNKVRRFLLSKFQKEN